jgi:multiple sugar transport system permease protein
MTTVANLKRPALSGKRRTLQLGQALSYFFLSLGAGIMLAPFVWMLSTSLKPTGDVFKYPPKLIGSAIEWGNYLAVFERSPFVQQFWNTVFIAVITTIGTLITSAMAGYAFSWITKFRGKNTLFLVFLVSIMIPYHVLLVPTFALLRNMRLLDTPWAIILPSIVSPFGIFLMRQFFYGVPKELAEAATLDGCNLWGIFWRIFLPLSKPALTTLAIFTFVGTWNDFLRPLIYLSSNENQTLTLGIYAAQGLFSTNWPVLMAMVALSLLPVVIMFLALQDLFVKGVALTGIKG